MLCSLFHSPLLSRWVLLPVLLSAFVSKFFRFFLGASFAFFFLLSSASAELFTGTLSYDCSAAMDKVTADFSSVSPTIINHDCQLSENLTPNCDYKDYCSFTVSGVCNLYAGQDRTPEYYDFHASGYEGCAGIVTNSCVANAHLATPASYSQSGDYSSGICYCNENYHVSDSFTACVPDEQEPPPDRVCNPETGDGCATADKQDYQSDKLAEIKNAIVSADGKTIAKLDELIKAVNGISYPDIDSDGDQDTDNSNDGDSNNDGQDDDKGAVCEDADEDEKCDDAPTVGVCDDVNADMQCDGKPGDSDYSTGTPTDTNGIVEGLRGEVDNVARQVGSLSDTRERTEIAIEEKKAAFHAKLDEIKIGIAESLTATTPTGNAHLPCYQNIPLVGNAHFDMCFKDYEDELSQIPLYIYGLGFLIAGFIILRRD